MLNFPMVAQSPYYIRSIYDTVGRSIASISDLGGIVTLCLIYWL